MKDKFPGFKKCMAMMRKHDGQTQEDGFHWLLPHAGDFVRELIEEFKNEKDLGLVRNSVSAGLGTGHAV
jgi:hypothetical protein